jgi:cyclopropane fatty-acyl-phospholipid synthase-like methyltransferase
MTHASFNTATGHEILAAAGKTVLRPGGRAATQKLFDWANFKPDETVLELASGLGSTAITLAKRYGVSVVGVEQNPDRVAIAKAKVRAAGFADRINIIQGNALYLDGITERFDYVLAEAILTLQSPIGKRQILTLARDRLKPQGQFLSHELLVRDRVEQIRQALEQAIRAKPTPLQEQEWIDTFSQAGLTVTQHQSGAMGLLNPVQVLQDEGVINTARILWNLMIHPPIRDRVLAMRQIFDRYQQDLGYIAISATVTDY